MIRNLLNRQAKVIIRIYFRMLEISLLSKVGLVSAQIY